MKRKNSDFLKEAIHIFLPSLPLVLLSICSVIGFYLAYRFTSYGIFLSVGLFISFLLLLAALILCFIQIHKRATAMKKDLFMTTHGNFQKMLRKEILFQGYSNPFDLTEIHVLNDDVEKINRSLSRTVIQNDNIHYDDLPLLYVDEERHILEKASFHNNLKDLIMKSGSFRNALLLVYYDFDKNTTIQEEEQRKLSFYLSKQFENYQNRFIASSTNHQGIYVYLPVIDSIHAIREKCEFMMKDLSYPSKDQSGAILSIPVRFALICYPFSKINEMFSDIHFARRMGKTFNFYFPRRLYEIDNHRLTHNNTIDLNISSKILTDFRHLDDMKDNPALQWEKMKDILREILHYFYIDECGIVFYQDLPREYQSLLYLSRDDSKKDRFPAGIPFEEDFIKGLDEIADEDDTYFASRRENIASQIARYCDRFNVTSTFNFLVKGETKHIRALIYFNNLGKDMFLDSYLRESLTIASFYIGDFIITKMRQNRLEDEIRITDGVLKLSNCFLYKIEASTYKITHLSNGWNSIDENIQVGKKCYEAIYHLDSPCEKCPLKTCNKMKSMIQDHPMETSLTLNLDKDEAQKVLYVKGMKKNDEFTDDLFDQNYLINSYYSLILQMKNAYLNTGKGYLLLIKIDNKNRLMEKFGNERLTQALRFFFHEIRKLKKVDNIYFDKPDTFALLLNEYGQNDVINECEAIYDLSRNSYFSDGKTLFDITYLPVSYPQGYPSHKDFLKHVEAVYFSGRYQFGKNYIFLDENGYSRPASKRDFMLSIIDSKFKGGDFEVNLQPILRAKDRRITSAELLIRLQDDYRKIVFNTDELIKTAAENGKIGLISDSLIDYIGTLYTEYGWNTFRPYGFDHLNINTDFSYLSDKDLREKLSKLIQTSRMPSHFLGLEINEREVYDHLGEMKQFISLSKELGINLIIDRYSGEFIPIEKLKELGINELKIDRIYTRFIDTDRQKYTMVKGLLLQAKENDIKVALIGVENMEQYKRIMEIDSDAFIQGYAFYKPIGKDQFVGVLRKNNSVLRLKGKQ